MKQRSVFIDDERLPDDGDEYVSVPKSDPNRFYKITLYNRRRGGRITTGTAGLWRLRFFFEAIANRHPGAWRSKSRDDGRPMTIRTRRNGPLVAEIEPLKGPSVDAATKH